MITWIILGKSKLTTKRACGKKPRLLPSGQYLVRVCEENEEYFSGYVKYTREDLRELDLTQASKHIETIETHNLNEAFASKHLSDGRSLFRRKHGVRKTIGSGKTESVILIVPYKVCKIDEVEVINCSAGDTCNLKVLDSIAGDYTGISSYLLNQFGFDVNLSDLYYTDTSNYDATLNIGMQVNVEITNNTEASIEYGVNFVLHEVK